MQHSRGGRPAGGVPGEGMVVKDRRRYRLGLDVGTNSIGWFIIWLNEAGEPEGLGPGGVRIFPDGRDPQSGTSNAVDRRVARGLRRRRGRYLLRRADLMQALIRHGLMPAEETARKALETLDPYGLRKAALDGPLPLHHFGRALFHLAQRRGFKSNRKSDKADEKGAIKQGETKLAQAMQETGASTLGVFLAERHAQRETVRVRNTGSGTKVEYDFYPARGLVEDEFAKIWSAQASHHPALTEAARAEVHGIIFRQRPLREPPVGKCALSPAKEGADADGFRCPWAHPLAQRFRIWQEVRNLVVAEAGQAERRLTKEEGDKVALLLLSGDASFDKIRRTLKLADGMRFNLESEKRPKLDGDRMAVKLSHKTLFGKGWAALPQERQVAIVDQLLTETDEAALVAWLVAETGLAPEVAGRVADALLPDGHCRLGLRAIRAILPRLEAGLDYADAAKAALSAGEIEYDHAKGPTGEVLDRLPYYGEWLQDDVAGTGDPRDTPERRYGRLPNPTVHIGLGQLRRVVNAIVREYGPPDYELHEAVIELARALKQSPRQKQEDDKKQAENQKYNDLRRAKLVELGRPPTPTNMAKLRLWEELNPKDPLDRRCPFTGTAISIEMLLSDEVEVEHLIPFSVSLDDSAGNKVVAMRFANRNKGNRTPYQAFGDSPVIGGFPYDWDQITARAAGLPKTKRWRFAPDALDRFKEEGGFLARQLNETGWFARMAKDYLAALTGPYKTWVLPGRLTAMIRGKWGLNDLLPDHNYSDAKNRKDHRHHAIDAVVAGLTDRGLLNMMARAYDEERDRVVIPVPWEGFRDDLAARLEAMVVSHKPDHGAGGKLHEDTAYGVVRRAAPGQPDEDGNLVYRKAFEALNEKEVSRIRDRRLRDLLATHLAETAARGLRHDEGLRDFRARQNDAEGPYRHIRHVRLLKREDPGYLVSIGDGSGIAYKAYSAGANAFIDVCETSDGKWVGEVATVFQANRPGHRPSWHHPGSGLRFVMRVHKGDLIRVVGDNGPVIMVAYQLEAAAGRFRLAPHQETGSLQERHADPDDPFRWLIASYSRLKAMGAERVRVDELGRPWRVRPDEAMRSLSGR